MTKRGTLLAKEKDPMGRAIMDFYMNGTASRLRVFSSLFDEDEIPVTQLFRNETQMPRIEQTALELSQGKVLDVGAGSGCHSLALQEMGKEVTAIDISPLSAEVMRKRGVSHVYHADFFSENFCGSFDTILMLMNGSGIIGCLDNMPFFFQRVKQLLAPGGCILMDSSDLRYIFEEEDGSFLIDLAAHYYGEVDFTMQYKDVVGDSFDWLYIDFQTLKLYAEANGFEAELIQEGGHYDYLARLFLRQ